MASNKEENTESVPSEERFKEAWEGPIFSEKYRAGETLRSVLREIDLPIKDIEGIVAGGVTDLLILYNRTE